MNKKCQFQLRCFGKQFLAASLALLGVGTALAVAPQVTDVTAAQRAGAKLVDIAYTLTGGTPACVVSASVSTNNGATYDLTATNFSGNGYGASVTPGAGKAIVWNAGADWDGHYSTQVWVKIAAQETSTNPLTFTLVTNINVDQGTNSIWAQPVFDGTNIAISVEMESKQIAVRRYDLNLNPVGLSAVVATTNDTAGENIADHKHVFQNNYHYLVFSISGSGDGGHLWLTKFDRNLTRVGIVQVVTNEPPTNDMLLFGDGEYLYVGKFYPEGQAAHKIYKYDGNLNFITNYIEGTTSNTHANADTAMYLDGNFYFVSPQYVGPNINEKYYRIVYDTNFNTVKTREIILQDTNKLGTVNGLSYYNGRFIVHYMKGSNEANPVGRAVYDAINWSSIQNETIISGSNHATHTIIVNNALYLGYTEQSPGFHSRLAKYTITETPTLALTATGIGYVGPVVVNTLGFSSIVSADYDGDGLADPGIYDEATGTWKVRLSTLQYALFVSTLNGLGGPGFTPVSADYDGDRKADPAVYQETTGKWIILPSVLNYIKMEPWILGAPGYSGMPADYDGDRKADPAIYERSRGDWQALLSSANYISVEEAGLLGGSNYWAVAGVYNADNFADPAVFDETTGDWEFLPSPTYNPALMFTNLLGVGGVAYIPVPADYDGDGLTDPAVRSATGNEWVVMLSDSGYILLSVTVSFE
ncbi:MAG: hypothetical protein HYV35_06990 [Lentisphaerae bacterium]|nr:hypothetical protein [Lentisphaerota bacterium]